MDKMWLTHKHETKFNSERVFWSSNNGIKGAMLTESIIKRVNDGILVIGLLLHLTNT